MTFKVCRGTIWRHLYSIEQFFACALYITTQSFSYSCMYEWLISLLLKILFKNSIYFVKIKKRVIYGVCTKCQCKIQKEISLGNLQWCSKWPMLYNRAFPKWIVFERTVLNLTAVINHYSFVKQNKIISSSFIHTALQLLLKTVPNKDKLGNYKGRQRAQVINGCQL